MDDSTGSPAEPALLTAARAGDAELVRTLIAQAAALDETGEDDGVTPLSAAAERGHLAVVALLVKWGADVHRGDGDVDDLEYKSTPLHAAARGGHVAVLDLLCRAGADMDHPDGCGLTPLHSAAEAGHVGTIEALVDLGADVDAEGQGETPLHIAALAGHAAAVAALLGRGAEVDAYERWQGATPLFCAAQEGHIRVVELLIAAGADVNARMMDGSPVLLGTAAGNHVAVIKLLVDSGARVNVDEDWGTALFEAATAGHVAAVRALASRGATPPTAEAMATNLAGHYHRVINGELRACLEALRAAGSWDAFAAAERHDYARLRARWRRDSPTWLDSTTTKTVTTTATTTTTKKPGHRMLMSALTQLFALPDGPFVAILAFHLTPP
ncbi:ankyrin repeat-containing domain protein [Pelagophyceae sp. CCMP2097]|nr:ankyrin repeat-containing domain protein [Pelagophyceae sp. CCMP2097]